MPSSSVKNLAPFPFGVGFLGEEVSLRPQFPFSDSQSDSYLPFEPCDAHQPLPHAAVRLQDPYLRCDGDLGWNIDWAVAFIVDRLEHSWTDAVTSLRSIRLRAAILYTNGLSQEVPFHIFDKLDQILFAEYLKNAVFFDTSNLSESVLGATYTHRRGPNPETKRISIIINRDVLRNGQPRDIVATLIHHMIHAYFLVACGGQKENKLSYGCLAHDVHFGKIMRTIKRLSAAYGRELVGLDYRHRCPGIQHFANDCHSSWRRDRTDLDDRNAWHCSQCDCNVRGPSESEIGKWYKKICKPIFNQPHSVRKLEVQVYNYRDQKLDKRCRARLVSSAKSVEFLFQERPVLVERKKIEQFEALDVSEDTFMRFLQFLHSGSYRPDPRSFAAAAMLSGLDADHKGPPIIKLQTTLAEAAVVLADVQFAKLSTLLGFEDCKSYALDRMNTYSIMYEDPVAVLKEIYQGDEVDSDLKAWARKFLTRTLVY